MWEIEIEGSIALFCVYVGTYQSTAILLHVYVQAIEEDSEIWTKTRNETWEMSQMTNIFKLHRKWCLPLLTTEARFASRLIHMFVSSQGSLELGTIL